MIKCCHCQATYIGETGRNLNIRLTEHKRVTRKGDISTTTLLSTIYKQTTESTETFLMRYLTYGLLSTNHSGKLVY